MSAVGVESIVDDLRVREKETRDLITELREQFEALTETQRSCTVHVNDAKVQLDAAQTRLATVQARVQECGQEIQRRTSELTAINAERQAAEQAAREREVSREEATRPRPQASVADDEVLAIAERLGQFSAADIAAMAKLTGKAASARVAKLVKSGDVKVTDLKFAGKPIFEFAGLAAEDKAQESEALILVRDFVVKQGDKFTPKQITDETEVVGQELVNVLQELLRMGTIEYVGFDDLELYAYSKPTEPGIAAETDMARRKVRAQASTRSDPVAGTGGKWAITNADVRALAETIVAAGGKVEPASSGHYAVTVPGSKRRILISGTPSSRRSVQNDRARVRRELGLRI